MPGSRAGAAVSPRESKSAGTLSAELRSKRVMLRRALTVLFVVALFPPPEAWAAAGRAVWRTSSLEGEARPVRYLLYVPSAYDPEARAWPLLVGFHGTAGTPDQILEIRRLVELAERHGFVVVCPASSGWYGRELWSKKPRPLSVRSDLHVADVLERTLEELRIDDERVFLLGVSKGGAGAWHWAFKEPERWAGIAAVAPATYSPSRDWDHIAGIPAIVIQGAEDRAVSVPANRRLAREMKGLGMTHRYVELPGVGHDLSEIDVAGEVFRFFLQVAPEPSGGETGNAAAHGEVRTDDGVAESGS